MAKNGQDRSNAIVDQFMRIAKYAPKEPKQPVTLQEQIDHLEKEKKARYAQEEKDRKQRDIDREYKKTIPVFSGNPQGVKAEMEYWKQRKAEEAKKKK